MELHDGSVVGVIGGGPAGAFTAYFVRKMADLLGLDIAVDIYEPKDFSALGAKGCNHCAGLISESMVQFLVTEGIEIPPGVIMNTIDSYALHTESGHVLMRTPLKEMRIATVYRGGGPKGGEKGTGLATPAESFDGYLLKLACSMGARLIPSRVIQVAWDKEKPRVTTKDNVSTTYDLLVGAIGVNGTGMKMFEELGFGYTPPKIVRTFITDFHLGGDVVEQYIGNTMHVCLLNIPGIKLGAVIPKGPFATVCFVAESEITNDLIDRYCNHPEIRKCFPPDWVRPNSREACLCMPYTNVGDPVQLFSDRVVMVGDCGVANLFKNGIGSAYRSAKALANTAILWGVSREDFEQHYQPVCEKISFDNDLGHLVLGGFGYAKKVPFVRDSILFTAAQEQNMEGHKRIMSATLWNSFSGSSSYVDIVKKALSSPGFMGRYLWMLGKSALGAKYVSPTV